MRDMTPKEVVTFQDETASEGGGTQKGEHGSKVGENSKWGKDQRLERI